MIKKLLCVLCFFFIFMFSIAIAETCKEDVVTINNIQMLEHVAAKIVNYAQKNEIDIVDKNGNKVIDIKADAKYMSIYKCDLMDAVSELYNDAINDTEDSQRVIDRTKKLNNYKEVTIYVDKKRAYIESLIIL